MIRICFSAVTGLALSLGHLDAEPADPPVAPVDEPSIMAPIGPTATLPAPVQDAIDGLIAVSFDQANWDPSDTAAFDILRHTRDHRIIWTLADLQRFAWRPAFRAALTHTAEAMLGTAFDTGFKRDAIVNTLIATDVPSYPGYLAHKRRIFTHYIQGWEALFLAGDIDWQLVDWGGVQIDDRPFGSADTACNCIPAMDNPAVETATAARWLDDDAIVFGVVINGAARAYPRRIMEVREMVNDTLGGRDFAMPYCSLCGAAQAYFTDNLPDGIDRPILRTSGLLIRSNKVMYDLTTSSVFDTFHGTAVTGPLAERGVTLDKITVVTSRWADWRVAHPATTVLVEDLALGRDYNLRATRDANGPIFPVGDVDPRLPVHEDIIGVIAPDGRPVAFPRARAWTALTAGEAVISHGVRVTPSAGGLRAVTLTGEDLGSHQAFWFAWSQFHPDTVLWGDTLD